MKEPWTVERFIELLKRHDPYSDPAFSLICNLSKHPLGFHFVDGYLHLEGIIEELNERERQS